MKNCSSEFCCMFKRMLECGIPGKYFPEQISYIYNIDIEKVSDAFDEYLDDQEFDELVDPSEE